MCFYAPLMRLYHKKNAGLSVYYTGSNEPSHAPRFEWPKNTFKGTDLLHRSQCFLPFRARQQRPKCSFGPSTPKINDDYFRCHVLLLDIKKRTQTQHNSHAAPPPPPHPLPPSLHQMIRPQSHIMIIMGFL